MSKQVQATTQIKDRNILKKSLEEMGIKFTESGDTVSWGSGYQRCSVDFGSGKMSYDDQFGLNLNGVMQKYSVNFVKHTLNKLGHKVKSTKTLANGKVEIVASRG